MRSFVADARDPGFATIARWVEAQAEPVDELLLLGVAQRGEVVEGELSSARRSGLRVGAVGDDAWLPGADVALWSLGSPWLGDLARRSALDLVACGETEARSDDLPSTYEEAWQAMQALPQDIGDREARALYSLAGAADGEILAFDAGGRSSLALAAGAKAHSRKPPTIAVDAASTMAPKVTGGSAALEANLRAVGALDHVDLLSEDLAGAGAPLEGGPPMGLILLPRNLDYITAHAIALALRDRLTESTVVIRPAAAPGAMGGPLAVRELAREGLLPPVRGRCGGLEVLVRNPELVTGIELEPLGAGGPEGEGRLDRKSEPEAVDSKHYLSGRHIDTFVADHGPALSGRVIDHGCGNKPFERLLPNVTALVGVDIEQSSDERVDVLVEPRGPLPFPAGWFDGGLCTEVLEHCEEPGHVLAELGRVIRPGGFLVVTAPFVWPLHEEPRDFYRFSPHALAYLLDSAGFEVVEMASGGGLWEVVYQLQTALMDGFTERGRSRIRELNEEALARDAADPHPEISTHFPTLARRR